MMLKEISNLLTTFAAACKPGPGGNFLGFPTWYKYLDSVEKEVAGKCTPVLDLWNNPSHIAFILMAVVEILLRVAAMIAVAFVIYGGFRFILSQGDPEQAAHARSTIINALIGLVIAMISIVATNFLFRSLTD